MSFMQYLKYILPWRIYKHIELIVEKKLRKVSPTLYKILKFGRSNLNTQSYWNQVWSKEQNSSYRNYSELFESIAELTPYDAKVLDVGCGIGRLAIFLKEKRRAKVTCLDFSNWALERLSKQKFDTVQSTLPNIPLEDNSFDIVVATEVFEHIDNPEATLKQMFRVTKSKGCVMCSVPNDAMHPHRELEHQRSYDKKSLQMLLSIFSNDISIKSGNLITETNVQFLLGIANK